ncbi:helix-turn-helix domain-containing protein [Morganella morganii]|uniref:helix-turn-helix domain-containing protein n=1 Tax=Morganella morganii TaxID=582 RepID=UPI00236762FA|nr:helix-turn-helix transcriptional regulator [Morganella morganii]
MKISEKLPLSVGDGKKCMHLNYCAGRVIRRLRRERQMSGDVFGGIAGYSQQQISRYERGESAFTLPVLMQFADALGMTLWSLLDQVRFFCLHNEGDYILPDKWG